jgi:chromosome segregation ATPase
MLLRRRDGIHRIEVRIERLTKRAEGLLEDEQQTDVRLRELRQAGRRRAKRYERRLSKLRARREVLVEDGIRSILLALQDQAHDTRERLDRELERLAPIEAEWERLRETFDALEAAVDSPALEELAARWKGALAIPEFPVREREGYAKPFPQSAVVF